MDTIQKLALFVPPINPNFNPNAVPSSGEEYLQQVMYERNNCPDIVTVKPKTANTTAPPATDEDSKSAQKTTSTSLLFTPEWQEFQVAEFRKIRARVSHLRTMYPTGEAIELPEPEKWLEFCTNKRPLLKIMMQINQFALEELLELQVEWLQNNDETIVDLSSSHKWLSQWIYAVLACIHIPIEPSMHSILREIARMCIEKRKDLSPDDFAKVLPLNLLICIISHNFNQLDLSDNFIE